MVAAQDEAQTQVKSGSGGSGSYGGACGAVIILSQSEHPFHTRLLSSESSSPFRFGNGWSRLL